MFQPSTSYNRLEDATDRGAYNYWLTQEDIADIARIKYNYYKTTNKFCEFEIVGSDTQLYNILQKFTENANKFNNSKLTLILNLEHLHWTVLVINYHEKKYEAYYVDSLGRSIPAIHKKKLDEDFKIKLIDLSYCFLQQKDKFNCGLWALENAYDLSTMITEENGISWLLQQLKRERNTEYFTVLRAQLSNRLRNDPQRIARSSNLHVPTKTNSKRPTQIVNLDSSIPTSNIKRPREDLNDELAKEKLQYFTQVFIESFSKRIAIYHLAAKEENLSIESLKNEITTGFIGSLLGITIARNIVGSIPSLIASVRSLSSKYITKKKAINITKIFSEIKNCELGKFLAEAAIAIFQSYEKQFMQVSDLAGDKVALEKLAEDASERSLNYFDLNFNADRSISTEEIVIGILKGKSEVYFNPSIKKARLRMVGREVIDLQGKSFTSAKFYENIGLFTENIETGSCEFYKLKDMDRNSIYSFRRLLSWEKDLAGMLKPEYKDKYTQTVYTDLAPYKYILTLNIQEEAYQLLNKISSIKHAEIFTSQAESPKNIIFNLRKPIRNFYGRVESLNTLHQLLSAENSIMVISNAIDDVSLNSEAYKNINSIEFTPTSISGLGGIGKTQLALKYAQNYADGYDNNILWIDAERKLDAITSFKKLAIFLDITLKNSIGDEKETEQLVNDIYHFFSKSKSLFIFDNAENFREIEAFLPKAIAGKSPTILITSRFSNWINIANIFSLDVFTESESTNFLKSELCIQDNKQDNDIKELINVLQKLPLALQQCVAYIKNEKNVQNDFNVKSYVDLFKEKYKLLLNFNFSIYINDPYCKTVYTTWQVTLSKLNEIKIIGAASVKLLSIMAYLYPDNINNKMFLKLKNNQLLSSAIKLLKDYSMINEGAEQTTSTIHRLTQYVLRINLESRPQEFKETVDLVSDITADFKKNRESMTHYLNFLLHMIKQETTGEKIYLKSTPKKIIHILSHYEEDEDLFNLIFSEADLILPKKKYFEFINEALSIYSRIPLFNSLNNIFNFITNKLKEGKISLDDAAEICKFKTVSPPFGNRYARFSSIPEVRNQQHHAVILLSDFISRIIHTQEHCLSKSVREKRDLSCPSEFKSANEYQKIDSKTLEKYLKNLHTIVKFANSAVLSKDAFSALINGDFDSVATTFSLIISGVFLDKISNKLLIKSEEQVLTNTNKLILDEELDYQGALALNIFSDEKILLSGRRRFLANGLKIAAPFVARGTSFFFAYNFLKGLASNQTEIFDNIANGGIVAIDLGMASIEAAEYLDYLSGVSLFTGPIGEGISFATMESLQIYHGYKQLSAIDKWVHLSDSEVLIQSLRASFNLNPSKYLDAKISNNQQVNISIAFLEQYPNIQRYVFSAWYNTSALYQDQVVFLDAKRNIRLFQNEIPSATDKGSFFCLSGDMYSPHINSTSHLNQYIQSELDFLAGIQESPLFFCRNSIGVELTENRIDDITLLMLHEGNDLAILSNHKSISIINNGEKKIRAGHNDDLFILIGNYITGNLQGNLGENIVKFSDYHPSNGVTLLDMNSILCGTTSSIVTIEAICDSGLRLANITQIYGRVQKQDIIFLNEKVTYIDTYEGENNLNPDYMVITENSSKNITIVLRPNTMVLFHGSNVTNLLVNYKIPPNQVGDVFVRQPFNSNISGQFYFESFLEDLTNIELHPNSTSIQLTYLEGKFNILVQDINSLKAYNNTNDNENFFIKNYSFLFRKNLEMRLSYKTIYIRFHFNISDEEVLSYARAANRLDKAMFIEFNNNETIFIGNKKHNVLSTDGNYANHLLGNADQIVYVIKQPSYPVDHLALKPIYIHNVKIDSAEVPDTLILSELFSRQDNFSDLETAIVIREDNQDLILTINSNYIKSSENITLAFYENVRIILKSAMVNYWFQDLDIILEKNPMTIVGDDTSWRLMAYPLVYGVDKNIIIISEDIVMHDREFFILKKIGQYVFFRHNNSDLYLTNFLELPIKSDLYTIVFVNFFQNTLLKEKILNINVRFLDESIIIGEHTDTIDCAKELDLNIVNLYTNNTIEVNRTRLPRSADKDAKALTKTFFDDTDNYYLFQKFITAKSLSTASISNCASIKIGIVQTALRSIKNSILNLIKFTNTYYFSILKKTGDSADGFSDEIYMKEATSLVYCNENNIFTQKNCIKNQSSLGVLGYCTNEKQVIIWFHKNLTKINTSPTILWFAIGYNGFHENIYNNANKNFDVTLSLKSNELFLSNKNGCSQIINLEAVRNLDMATLFPYLPEKIKLWLLRMWDREEKMNVISQDKFSITICKQQSLQIGLNYIGNLGLLHSFIGDYFQALGLKPNWREHDQSYFLARWLNVTQQLILDETKINILGAAILETAILHPKLQRAYSSVFPKTENCYKKLIFRFLADLLQGNNLNFALIPCLLKILFSNHLSTEVIYGLSALLSFYSINNNHSYYYLGIALFLLPQLPLFFECFGIPVTTYVLKIVEKLVQLFISQSLLEQFRPTLDESRLTQSKIELKAAEQRVAKGNERIAKPLSIFFKSNLKPSDDCSKNLPTSQCIDSANTSHRELTRQKRNI